MPFVVETLSNPDVLLRPDSLMEMLNINYNQLLIHATNAFKTKKSNFLTLKNNLNTNIMNLFQAYTTLTQYSTLLTDNLANIKDQLDTLKINNRALKQELDHMYDIGYDSNELINDYKRLYNINYSRNWGILLSIFFACYLLSTMFVQKKI